jgi:hypothetical protein
MADPNIIRSVDHLLAVESTSLLERLAESASYVATAGADDATAIAEMIEDAKQNTRSLVELLDVLDAAPGPRRVDTSSADIHFARIETVIPRLIADKQWLIREYEAVAIKVASEPRASEVVASGLNRHRAHLKRLQTIQQAVASS